MVILLKKMFDVACKHRSLNREFFSDTCWTLSMYLEAVAMVPQIYMFQKQAADEGGSVEVRCDHYHY